MIVPFLIGTVAVVLMFQGNLLIFVMKQYSVDQIPLPAIAQYILLKTPSFLNMTLPVGMSLASSLAISRLARESELTAMRSAGVSISRVVVPILFVGVLVAVGNFAIVERVMPPAERAARKLGTDVGLVAAVPSISTNVVLRVATYTASIGTVAREGDRLLLSQVLLVERPRPDETWIYEAASGMYDKGRWTLTKPYLRILKGEALTSAKVVGDLILNERIVIPDVSGAFQGDKVDEEKTAAELLRTIEVARKAQQPGLRKLETLYHIKFSVPAACVVFALTGPVFAVALARSGAFIGVLVSIFMVLIYYNVFVISNEILAKNGWVSPFVAAWLPNVLLFAAALLALRRLE